VDGEFIQGPIPIAWLSRACELPGPQVVEVALAIWFLQGLPKRGEEGLKLTSKTLKRFHVRNRSTKSRALKALEEAGLIRVERRPNQNPLVTILDDSVKQ
jgi:hypothetical protein